ncbi:hypothetical protein SDC9_189657 [bioreactor metagenome]|uniref:Uncharacterized protein n=1 Tax=bioreactor metagenome TaxID=1076179 RepID=A0A645HST0_9ZZZZ
MLQDSIAFLANKQKNLTTRQHHNNKGELTKIEEITCNSAGKETKHVQTTNNSSIRLIYDYDSTLTRVLEERWYSNSKLIQRIKYIYNQKGYLDETIELDEKDKQLASTKYEYDILSGLVIGMKAQKHVTNYEYNFDNNNNCTTKYEFYDDYPVKITEREIKYR